MTVSCHCSRKFLATVLVCLTMHALPLSARTPALFLPGEAQTVNSFRLGIGHTSSLDTYLSPARYSGTAYSVEGDMMSAGDSSSFFPYSSLFLSLSGSPMLNEPGNGSTWQLMGKSYFSLLHSLVCTDAWDCLIGPSVLFDAGILYARMNSNNPANGIVSLALGATLDNTVRFSLGRFPLALRSTLYLPLAGAGFAPDHDQLYWLMYSFSQYGRAVHFESLFNAPAATESLQLVIPAGDSRITVGCTLDFMHNRLGGNKTHIEHEIFTIGMVHRFERKSWNK